MNKKIFTAVIALSVVAGSAFAQTKQLSAPVKTETTTETKTTTAPAPTTTPGGNTQTTAAPTKTAPQTVTPPEAVAAKFKTMYPSVPAAKWMQNKQGKYVAMFKNNGTESRTVFSADGSVVREVTVVQKSALPAGVTAYLDKNFMGKTPKRCEEFKNAKGTVVYIIKYDDKVVRLDTKGNEVSAADMESDDMDAAPAPTKDIKQMTK